MPLKKIITSLSFLLVVTNVTCYGMDQQSAATPSRMDQIIDLICTHNIEERDYDGFFAKFVATAKEIDDFNIVDKYNTTLLNRIIGRNSFLNRPLREQIIKFLLEHGADPAMTTILVQAGTIRIDYEKTVNNKNTALHIAAQEGWINVLEMLSKTSQFPAMLNATNEQGKTPLHLASSAEASQFLLVNDALVEGVQPPGKRIATPLHDAARLDRPLIVQALLIARAPLDACDSDGNTPLAIASTERYCAPSAVALLLERGANPRAADATGLTPFDKALRGSNPEQATPYYACERLEITADDLNKIKSLEIGHLELLCKHRPEFKAELQPIIEAHWQQQGIQQLNKQKRNQLLDVFNEFSHIHCFNRQAFKNMYQIANNIQKILRPICAFYAGVWAAARTKSLMSLPYGKTRITGCVLGAALCASCIPRLIPFNRLIDWTFGTIIRKKEQLAAKPFRAEIESIRVDMDKTIFAETMALLSKGSPLAQ